MPPAFALCALLAVGGCFQTQDDTPVVSTSDPELLALMADGVLPGVMAPGPMSSPPPRFCIGGPSEEDDAGVSSPPDAGGGTGGRGGGVPVPITPGNLPPGTPIPPGLPPGTPVPIVVSAGSGGVIGSAGAGPGGSVDAGSGMGSAGVGQAGSGPVAGSGMGAAGKGDPGSGGGGSCESLPIGFWRFDDCNTTRTDLADSSFQRHSAFRTVDLACTTGQQGPALAFSNAEDMAYAPDQPDFALDAGMTIAAWVKPDAVDRVRTLFRKRDDLNSAFALVINNKKFQFVIRLASGGLATVSTPAQAGKWTHVAATYDGMFLRLYIDGHEAKRTKAPGAIARGIGPLLMGNDVAGRRFQGQIDEVWFNTLAAPDTTILELTCLHRAPSATITPVVGPAVQAGTAVTYVLSITNHDDAICAPATFLSFVGLPAQDFSADPSSIQTSVASGTSSDFPIVISSGEETEAGSYALSFQVLQGLGGVGGSGTIDGRIQLEAQYVVAEPSGCHVSSNRELMIRDVSVVDDPVRTSLDGPATDPSTGAWTFGRMMERLSPTAADAPDVTEAMFQTFLSPQTINGFSVDARPLMDPIVLAPWPRSSDGKLDLARAPMRLLAITNRLDLKDLAKGKAGEGRLVYGVLDSGGNPMEFTVILEYLLPASNEAEFRVWADAFHALQALPFPSPAYNQALQEITDSFSARNAIPGNANGSALIDIRTNEIVLSNSFIWQLREFHISPTTGFMDPATLFLTPDSSFNFSAALARFINANEATILTETHDVPLIFEDAPFLAGAVFNNIDFWSAPGIANPEARHKFSLNTCNGCHGAETGTRFLQINPRSAGESSFLSGFLTGVTVFDPETGQPRRLAELARRRQLMESVLCATGQP
jgi:hypothetical protein